MIYIFFYCYYIMECQNSALADTTKLIPCCGQTQTQTQTQSLTKTKPLSSDGNLNIVAIEIECSNREAWGDEATAAIYTGVNMDTLMLAARLATQEWVDAEREWVRATETSVAAAECAREAAIIAEMASERAAIACVAAATGSDVADGEGVGVKAEEIAWAAAMAERTRGAAMRIERRGSTIRAARADSAIAIMSNKCANEMLNGGFINNTTTTITEPK